MSASGLNETHDPSLRSWVASANGNEADFPIQNLPFGVFRRADTGEPWRGGVAIGDAIVDLAGLHAARLVSSDANDALAFASRAPLNDFAALGNEAVHALRVALSRALRSDSTVRAALDPLLVPQKDAEMTLPMHVGDYTDFYTSRYHAYNVGTLFRPDAPLYPNYAWVPIGYHGRASSVVISGTPVVRPSGQYLVAGSTIPEFGPSRRLDYELELGIFIGSGNELGRPIAIDDAEAHVFGFVLLNDWSARDIQAWEYQPLGPFLGKNFATTISPWVVTLEALAPYRTPLRRGFRDPPPLPYLAQPDPTTFEIEVAVGLASAAMRARGESPLTLGQSTYADAFWTPAQLVTHHASNGCNLRAGDLLGTGTLSGPTATTFGSLLERTDGGRVPIAIAATETRRFVDDGDDVALNGACSGSGRARLGFGACVGTVSAPRV